MSLAPGATLGPYTIRAELGHGGMGVVYTAQDPRLDRRVAIKILPPELTRDDTAKQRFLQEAKAASALDYLNICTIHEINETDDGQLYFVMAYYEGETLKARIAARHHEATAGSKSPPALSGIGSRKNVRRRNLSVRGGHRCTKALIRRAKRKSPLMSWVRSLNRGSALPTGHSPRPLSAAGTRPTVRSA